jgi:hypothetical protein
VTLLLTNDISIQTDRTVAVDEREERSERTRARLLTSTVR